VQLVRAINAFTRAESAVRELAVFYCSTVVHVAYLMIMEAKYTLNRSEFGTVEKVHATRIVICAQNHNEWAWRHV